jgi:hypothetical protein
MARACFEKAIAQQAPILRGGVKVTVSDEPVPS